MSVSRAPVPSVTARVSMRYMSKMKLALAGKILMAFYSPWHTIFAGPGPIHVPKISTNPLLNEGPGQLPQRRTGDYSTAVLDEQGQAWVVAEWASDKHIQLSQPDTGNSRFANWGTYIMEVNPYTLDWECTFHTVNFSIRLYILLEIYFKELWSYELASACETEWRVNWLKLHIEALHIAGPKTMVTDCTFAEHLLIMTLSLREERYPIVPDRGCFYLLIFVFHPASDPCAGSAGLQHANFLNIYFHVLGINKVFCLAYRY